MLQDSETGNRYYVIYKIIPVQGREKDFEASWLAVTKNSYNRCGSLGSRLHKSEDRHYFAYAQWPGKAAWEKMESFNLAMILCMTYSQKSKEGSEVIFHGYVSKDCLKPPTSFDN